MKRALGRVFRVATQRRSEDGGAANVVPKASALACARAHPSPTHSTKTWGGAFGDEARARSGFGVARQGGSEAESATNASAKLSALQGRSRIWYMGMLLPKLSLFARSVASISTDNTLGGEVAQSKFGVPVRWETGSAAAIYSRRGDSSPANVSNTHGEGKRAEKEVKGNRNIGMSVYDHSIQSKQGIATELESRLIKEVESVMDGLGPRFEGWKGTNPIPIDGDMLPAIDGSFKTPVRRLPEGAKASLTDVELTALRKISKLSPTHFVLGRNKGHQGLAGAIVKLWERSEVVKIQIKRGVQHTRNQTMAEELKRLTGGVLLSRDKYIIVLYRGKDFLPEAVVAALSHQESLVDEIAGKEESLSNVYQGAHEGLTSLNFTDKVISEWENWRRLEEERKNLNPKITAAREQDARRVSHKLSVLMAKKRNAEADLAKVGQYLNQFNPPADRESIADEERKILREAGMKMEACVKIGKLSSLRVVVQTMHSQWKRKELVKLHLQDFDKESAKEVVKILEHESGGFFVTMLAANRGHVIIFYRGKSYDPRARTLAKTAFMRGTALKNCLRMKHQKSLERHLVAVDKEIDKIKDHPSLEWARRISDERLL